MSLHIRFGILSLLGSFLFIVRNIRLCTNLVLIYLPALGSGKWSNHQIEAGSLRNVFVSEDAAHRASGVLK